MKTFAIILLMLCSFSFLKAQMMVVETSNGVESFVVDEIKRLSAFKKQYRSIDITFKEIPIIISSHGQDKNFMYSTRQHTYNPFNFNNDRFTEELFGFKGMNLVFIKDKDTETGVANPAGGHSSFKIDSLTSRIKDITIQTDGTMGGCWNDFEKTYNCMMYGYFEIMLTEIEYSFDSAGKITLAALRGKEINSKIKKFRHVEETRESKTPFYSDYRIELKYIRENELTDDSQIIITIE